MTLYDLRPGEEAVLDGRKVVCKLKSFMATLVFFPKTPMLSVYSWDAANKIEIRKGG